METRTLVIGTHIRETVRGLERELLEDLHPRLLALAAARPAALGADRAGGS
jgi:hypothetical protein